MMRIKFFNIQYSTIEINNKNRYNRNKSNNLESKISIIKKGGFLMKKTISVDIQRTGLWLDAEVTFAQVEHWFGHTSRDLKMDVIAPFKNQSKQWPCIVWICGGAWIQMDYHAHLPNFIELARAGFVIASVEYRDSNAVTFPGQLEDVKAAIRYLRAHADRYNIDPNRIGVMGESAGGHLAAMVGVTGDYEKFDKGTYLEYSSSVQAVCPWYVPSSFDKMMHKEVDTGLLPESRLIGKDASKNPKLVQDASPISYITKNTPPFLLIHGTKDQVVPFSQSEYLYEALETHNVPVDLIAVEGADHADIHFFQKEIVDEIKVFFKKNL